MVGPGACGVDHHLGLDAQGGAAGHVLAPHPHHTSAVHLHGPRRYIAAHRTSQGQGLGDIVQGEHEGIHRAVVHGKGRYGVRGERGPHGPGGGDVDFVAGDTACRTHVREIGDVAFVVPADRHEQSAAIVDAVRGDAAQNSAFFLALHCGFPVRGHVPRSAVEQPVVSSRGAGVDVAPLDEQGGDAAQGEIAQHASPRDAAADDENAGLDGFHSVSWGKGGWHKKSRNHAVDDGVALPSKTFPRLPLTQLRHFCQIFFSIALRGRLCCPSRLGPRWPGQCGTQGVLAPQGFMTQVAFAALGANDPRLCEQLSSFCLKKNSCLIAKTPNARVVHQLGCLRCISPREEPNGASA